MTDVLAWIDISVGSLIGLIISVKLATEFRRNGVEPIARRTAWSNIVICLLAVLVGVYFLASDAKNTTAEWVVRLAIFALVGLLLVQWFRSRQRNRVVRGPRPGRR
jgi:hypothetical protein